MTLTLWLARAHSCRGLARDGAVVCRYAPSWGVYMQSCWCVWTAFEMPPRGRAPELEDEALDLS